MATKKNGNAEQDQKAAAQKKFQQDWLQRLMNNLTLSVPAPKLNKIMTSCGHGCAQRNAAAMIAKARGDLDVLLDEFGAAIGKTNVSREGKEYHLRYSKCYCPMVAEGPGLLPDAYCECGRGFIEETFGAVAGHHVSVALTHSIRRGDHECRFVVRVGLG